MGASRELWPDENTLFTVLYDKFMFWSILVGIFAFVWLLIAVLRYREGVDSNWSGEELKVGTFPKDRHDAKLEFAWFLGPTILILWVTWLAFGSMNLVWGNIPSESDSFTVEANGMQWYWEYRYQDELTWEDMSTVHDVTWDADGLSIAAGTGAVTAEVSWESLSLNDNGNLVYSSNSLNLDLANNSSLDQPFNSNVEQQVFLLDSEGEVVHRWHHIRIGQKMTTNFIIPCDEDVTINIHSDKYNDDNSRHQGVQHAFWLQEWGNKEDAVPGLESGTWLFVQPNEAGTFPVRCAEYCGEQHSVMTGEVEVVAEEGKTCDEDFGIMFGDLGALE